MSTTFSWSLAAASWSCHQPAVIQQPYQHLSTIQQRDLRYTGRQVLAKQRPSCQSCVPDSVWPRHVSHGSPDLRWTSGLGTVLLSRVEEMEPHNSSLQELILKMGIMSHTEKVDWPYCAYTIWDWFPSSCFFIAAINAISCKPKKHIYHICDMLRVFLNIHHNRFPCISSFHLFTIETWKLWGVGKTESAFCHAKKKTQTAQEKGTTRIPVASKILWKKCVPLECTKTEDAPIQIHTLYCILIEITLKLNGYSTFIHLPSCIQTQQVEIPSTHGAFVYWEHQGPHGTYVPPFIGPWSRLGRTPCRGTELCTKICKCFSALAMVELAWSLTISGDGHGWFILLTGRSLSNRIWNDYDDFSIATGR